MPATVTTSPSPEPRLLGKIWGFFKISPITTLLIYCVLSVMFKENFPFSNFPMYSNPSPERMYYALADGDGKILPVATLTGITSPKIGKIYRKIADERSRKIKVSPSKFTPEQVQAIGLQILKQLRHEAENKKQTLPAKLQIIKTYISYKDGQIVETSNTFATE